MALNTTYQYEQPKIPSSWLKDDEARRFYNRLIEVLDDVYLKYGRFDVKMFSESGLKSVIDATETTMASEIESPSVTTNVLKAALAEMMAGKIGTARIDYAQITDAAFERIFTDVAVSGKIAAKRLQIESAQIVDLVVNSFRLVNEQGQVYQVTVDQSGNLQTERKEDEDEMFADGKIPTGYSAVASSLDVGDVTSANLYVTGVADVMKLTAKYLSSDNAFINELTGTAVFATYLLANKAFLENLYVTTIYGGKSIQIIAGQAETADSAAAEAKGAAQTAREEAAAAQSTADGAKTDAGLAQSAADAAQTDINEVNAYLEITGDGIDVVSSKDNGNRVSVTGSSVDVKTSDGNKLSVTSSGVEINANGSSSKFVSNGVILGNYFLWHPGKAGGLAFNLYEEA